MLIELRFRDKSGTMFHERDAYTYDGFALIPSVGDIVYVGGRRLKVADRIFYYTERSPDFMAEFGCEEA
jgi:hypothetical protein